MGEEYLPLAGEGAVVLYHRLFSCSNTSQVQDSRYGNVQLGGRRVADDAAYS